MRFLKQITPALLVLAAIGVVLATVFTDHSSDYGQVSLPEGGTVALPEGTVIVFYDELGSATQPTRKLSAPLNFKVTPAGGGAALPEKPTADNGTGEYQTTRSEDIGQLGSIAEVEVPATGDYVVSGSSGRPAGSSYLTFGTSAFNAVARKWRLLAALLGAAILVMLIPTPRRRHRYDDAPGAAGWSSDPRSPYAG
jgi:hypothetical protein